MGHTEERAFVMTTNVTVVGLAPGVIVAEGENVAVVPVGRPVAVNVMGLENVPFKGATIRLKSAGCPAATEVCEVGGVTE